MTFLKKPSAWIPLVMSSFAILLVIGYVELYGVQKSSGDEGSAARLFQLLLVGQLPIIGYFAAKNFPTHQKEAVQIVVIPFLAALLPFVTVLLLEM